MTDTDSQPLPTAAGRLPLWAWPALIAFAGLLYGTNLGGASSLSDHEMLVGGIAQWMAMEGNWDIQRIGDALWLEKPPLAHWLAGLSGLAWGEFTELSVRFPSAIAGVLVALLVAWQSARWFGPTVGVLAGCIQASTVAMLKYARLAEVDILLVLLVATALVAFWNLQQGAAAGRRPTLLRLIFWICTGATFLAKGPFFGAVLIGVTVGGWLLIRRDWPGIARTLSPAGIALALLITLSWPVIIIAQGHGDVLWDEWFRHVVERGRGAFGGDPAPIWYYGPALLWQLLPWTPLLLFGAGPSLRRAWHDPDGPDRFVWCWALLPIALLSLAAFKHQQYILYAFPAFAPIMALGLVRVGHWLRAVSKRTAQWHGRFVLGLAVLLAGGALAGGLYWPEYRRDAWMLGAVLSLGFAAIGLGLVRARVSAAGAAVMITVLAAGVLMRSPLIPRRDHSGPDTEFLARVADQVPMHAALLVSGGDQVARHQFYIDRPVDGVFYAHDLPRRAPTEQPFYAVIRARDVGHLREAGSVQQLDQSARARFEREAGDRFTLYRVDPNRPT